MRASTYLMPLLLGCTALAGCVVAPVQGQYYGSGQIAPGQYASGDVITEAPPPLLQYEQPPIPAEGYIWTPGFYQHSRVGYYWIPGVWVEPPSVGLLWTPGYWGFSGGYYSWNAPYWGPTVGYYGGINYGYGYFGRGYEGGRWDGGRFRYNEAHNNFGDRRFSNSYNAPTQYRGNGGRTSFNGGTNGVRDQPGPGQQLLSPDQRRPPTAAQTQHYGASQGNVGLQQLGNPGIARYGAPQGNVGLQQLGNPGTAPGGQFNRPSGQTQQPAQPPRQNFGQQPNYAPAPQQQRPNTLQQMGQPRPQPAQQAAPLRQAPAVDMRPTQRPQQQQNTPPPPRNQRQQFNGPERP
jgi:hypothetical protein